MENLVLEETKRFVRRRFAQFIPGTTESIAEHSFRVAEILRTYGYDDDLQIAGYLHETLERKLATVEDLRALNVSEHVIAFVETVTLPDDKLPLHDKQRRLISRLMDARSHGAYTLKAADVLDELNFAHRLPFEERKHLTKTFAPWFGSLLKPLAHTDLIEAYLAKMRERLSERFSPY